MPTFKLSASERETEPDIDPGYHPYQERYVAFLDVLGFSAMVDGASTWRDREEIYEIIYRLRNWASYFSDGLNPPVDARLTQFSDCLVLSALPSKGSIVWIMGSAQFYAASLIERGVLIRGGIAFGKLIHDDVALFGPGLMTAYRSDVSGGAPRVLLDSSIIPEIPADDLLRPMSEFIRRDHSDNSLILHTLHAYARASHNLDRWPEWRREEYQNIVELIRARCSDPNLSMSVRQKWGWIAAYWNDAVACLGGINPV